MAPILECDREIEEVEDERGEAAQPREKSALCPLTPACSPTELAEDAEACNRVMGMLKVDCPRSQEVFEWLRGDFQELAVSKCGCRVVQRLLDVLRSEDRDRLVEELVPGTVELYESPWGNHVLTKVVEVMPAASLGPLIEQIMLRGYRMVARHKFGCRVLERLIEHATEKEMGRLLDLVVANSEELCRHEFSNFVIQSLLEHGSDRRRWMVVQQLLPYLPQLSSHRTASHVVQRMLNHSGAEELAAIIRTLFQAPPPHSLEDVAASRYGSFVVEELLTLRSPGVSEEITRRLSSASKELLKSAHFVRVAAQCGVVVPAECQEC